MRSIVCAVDESPGAAEAVTIAAALSRDLGLRLVLAHVIEGRRARDTAVGERLLERVAHAHGVGISADRRAEVGDRASELSRIAGEEAAAVIVVGSRARSRRGLTSDLAAELKATASCPVLVVPPPRR